MAVKRAEPPAHASATVPGEAVEVRRIPLEWTLAPERAALLVRDDQRPFALVGQWAGGGALVGSDPVRVAAADEDPFELLDEQPGVQGAPGAVGGGWFGWLGYELGRRLEPIGPSPPPARADPPFQLAFYDHLLHLDAGGQWWFEALWSEQRGDQLDRRLAELESRARTTPQVKPFASAPWHAIPQPAGHRLAVAACRERIHAGDLFQANICVRLESNLDGEPIDLFAAALPRLRPDRAAFVADPRGAVASLSPELFLERRGRRVRSAPIKGTRPACEREALVASDKDLAENVMIVDLVRNDLGRVCVPGSVYVEALAEPRPHVGVWHLVSEVSGVLREGVGDGELVRAAFPPGSVTGAPKIAAMNVIAELETTPRELYTGALGFASPLAGLELSVAIRTFEFRDGRAWLGVGGGIVADSVPATEAAECETKARPLLDAIGATLGERVPGAGSPAPIPRRLAPRPVPRPNPARGVFDTLLVIDGRPVELELHLLRLTASVRVLYGTELPAGLAQEMLAAAWGRERARLRVDVTPAGRAHIRVSPVAERRAPTRLCPVTVPGGIGPHKWSDRRLLHALSAAVEGEPLLCDLDGLVLETARANVFVVEAGGRLVTPPLDGRILPGVTRSRVIGVAQELGLEVRQEPVSLDRLSAAEEVFVTGSLGGVEPARGGPVSARLAIRP